MPWTCYKTVVRTIREIGIECRCVHRCGSAEGLDAGRHCLSQRGFRRCEDICWIKTNKEQRKAASVRQDSQALLQHTKVRLMLSHKICVRFQPSATQHLMCWHHRKSREDMALRAACCACREDAARPVCCPCALSTSLPASVS